MNKKRRKQKPNKYAQTGKFSALDEYVEKLKSGGAVFHCFLLILLHTQPVLTKKTTNLRSKYTHSGYSVSRESVS